jgi:GGDEF domain-containing protein
VSDPVAIILSATGAELPAPALDWLSRAALAKIVVRSDQELIALALRGHPRLAILDAREAWKPIVEACRRLKSDSYTGVVPVVAFCATDGVAFDRCFAAGADEVLHGEMSPAEMAHRLTAVLRRSDRDVEVHPSTRLPGTVAIEAELGRRIASGDVFAVCYADLDHFKEFNDRYSYYEGDRVIRIVAKLLHDVVKGLVGERGFVGHIGGDDFIFMVPAPDVPEICAEIVSVFDLLVPFQYSEPDRRAGYFFGKDRRGQLHRVPLMTLSIGVVTNERRVFTTASQVSELATEMKGYAKTLTGSVFSIDRRQDGLASSEPAERAPEAFSIIDDS